MIDRILSSIQPFSWDFRFSVTVNLADNSSQKVDMTHFDLLKVLGTGGERNHSIKFLLQNVAQSDNICNQT